MIAKKLINNCLRILLIFICIYFEFANAKTSINPKVDYSVDGHGFHRKINYTVTMENLDDVSNCYLAIHVNLPTSLYVNVDELADLQRLNENTVCSDGETNVEVFAENAGSQQVTICKYLNSKESNLILPLHQRYHAPLNNASYINVTIPKAKLLLGCEKRIAEYPVSKIDLCSPCVDLSIKWREVPYKINKDNYIWTIPVGDTSNKDLTIILTILSSIIGTIFVLRALWNSTSSS
ncbi:hypothetical protein HCN44_004617 [Aphidius gifuensis]|uniref:Phosphatidylinositol-glycan biosynthesis class X protein n=1 Tax=Aphidius gifuensis TaxID=684658 RepID=A0A834XX59_APHGI|nr:phosphatidylinositol-glycan biosynthesis class X protein [Aphidius gifuensis]XP_044003334.1 phosphatidylinositol-glycan biosynthesis class X protein [Aphidius gifuensis]KAF7995145.1 hypothetical protein HCN44_004617 [Aphidius gifuensis]